MNFKFLKNLLLLMIIIAVCSLVNATTVNASTFEQEKTVENCHTLTSEWFGNEIQVFSMEEENETGDIISEYFNVREQDFSGIMLLDDITENSEQYEKIDKEMQQHAIGIAEFQENAGIRITDAEITTIYGEDDIVLNEDGTVSIYLYEWTFFDYDDLSDDKEIMDVSGYGTYHKITLEKKNDQYVIIADEYDENDILGVCTMNESTEAALAEMEYEPYDIDSEIRAMMAVSYGMYDGYNPDAAAEYADRYVYTGATGNNNYEGYYNSAYANFNSVGGDCANYTSQCIYAGGMPQVIGTHGMTDGWYYKSGSDRSGTWTTAYMLEAWMASNRGNLVTASDSTIYKGSPVFLRDPEDTHATICVGKNSAGTPILNSHSTDRYHVTWKYWGNSATYTTVQLTDGEKPSYSFKSYIDSPTTGTVWENSVYVNGWAILGDGITNVTGWINGKSFNIPLYERTDVAGKYPGYPTGNEGFHAYIPLKDLKIGTNSLELYAYHNTDCYHIGNVEFTFTDTEAPVISNVTVKEDSEGYTITCDISDNIGIDYVQFPTWTTVNGQDDLVGNDGTWAYLECYRGTYADGKATFRVNKSEHNNETGQYQTDIYAHDKCNNESKYTLKYAIEDKVEEPPHSHLYTSKVTKEATCTEKGVKTYTCECKDSYIEEIPVKGHSYEEGSCIRCGEKDPDYVPETEVDPTSPQIIVESVTASAGETVDVKISLKNNPGIASMKLKVAYDSVLKLESVTYNNQLGGMSQQPQSMTNPVVLNWFNGSSNTSGDMTYAILKFKIFDTGQGGTSAIVNVSYNEEDVYNIAEENVDFAIVNGTVEIVSYIPGDINGDKEVNNKDVTRLFQYFSDWDVEVVEEALDVNGDGSINNKDLTRLFQYLSDWEVEIH